MCPRKTLAFCCTEHQRLIWHSHKFICGKDPETFELPDVTEAEYKAYLSLLSAVEDYSGNLLSYGGRMVDVGWEGARKQLATNERKLREAFIRQVRRIYVLNGHPVLQTLPPSLVPFVWVGLSQEAFSCPYANQPEEEPQGLLDLPESLINAINHQALVFYTLHEISEAEQPPSAFEDSMLALAFERLVKTYIEAEKRANSKQAAILAASSGRILSMQDDMRTLPGHGTGLGLELHRDKVRLRK
ncbi:hypothetical protein BCR35DRAFT_355554 [Leucosporidium creatinivorum]|uniref:MYND-type domain-containing protein n=1 Tax=Leucosporidium creatinivorum TaxID=106004 RepID=A0A1Y2DC00_9BASI|nr:hypothetical protein BCR35DRAFT_355554 [Leucosporidium creatinivorum]